MFDVQSANIPAFRIAYKSNDEIEKNGERYEWNNQEVGHTPFNESSYAVKWHKVFKFSLNMVEYKSTQLWSSHSYRQENKFPCFHSISAKLRIDGDWEEIPVSSTGGISNGLLVIIFIIFTNYSNHSFKKDKFFYFIWDFHCSMKTHFPTMYEFIWKKLYW